MGRDLCLRRADMGDAETLFRWRNDPDARENSFHTEPISYEEHVAWLEATLQDPTQEIYILCEGNTPIGQVRLSMKGGMATVSYSIDVAYRAQGYGQAMLQCMENLCVERGVPRVLRGYVKKNNIASQVIFESLEYTRETASDLDCFLYVKRKLQQRSFCEGQIRGGGGVHSS